MGSQDIVDRLRFEKPNPVSADVWFGGPTTLFDDGIKEGIDRAIPADVVAERGLRRHRSR